MKFYNNAIEVVLDRDVLVNAWTFAKQVHTTTNYSDANQHNAEKIRMDHFISRVGEEAAKQVFSAFAQVKGPDYNIYEANKKSWAADLFVNGCPLAVKTQSLSAAARYGLSWTFQDGVHRKDIILAQPEAWVVFVKYHNLIDPKNKCTVYPPFQIKDLPFGEPQLPHLKAHKKVVYADALFGKSS